MKPIVFPILFCLAAATCACWTSHAADGDAHAEGRDDGGVPDLLPDGCRPDCGGRECGPDPECGFACGRCRQGWECADTGTCRDRCDLPFCEQVFIPAGPFVMGSDDHYDMVYPPWIEESAWVRGEEMPEHIVHLSAYWIDVYEVTNERYLACVEAGACTAAAYPGATEPERRHHPASGRHRDAVDYCTWIGRRLATEAEWEKAARGGCEIGGDPSRCEDPEDERQWPWGWEVPDCSYANIVAGPVDDSVVCSGGPRPDTTPVGSFPAGQSPYGVHDMVGNAGDWVADLFGYYEDFGCEHECTDPTGPATGDTRIQRGCEYGCEMAWESNLVWSRVSARYAIWIGPLGEPPMDSPGYGFRCASDAL